MTPSWRQKKKVPSSLASLLNRRSKSANLSSGTYKQTTPSRQSVRRHSVRRNSEEEEEDGRKRKREKKKMGEEEEEEMLRGMI